MKKILLFILILIIHLGCEAQIKQENGTLKFDLATYNAFDSIHGTWLIPYTDSQGNLDTLTAYSDNTLQWLTDSLKSIAIGGFHNEYLNGITVDYSIIDTSVFFKVSRENKVHILLNQVICK